MLPAIAENPYRTLGLAPTATERELAKRASDLRVYAEMGKTRQYETDCADLIPLRRSSEAISSAADSLENPENRFFYATMWFWCRTPIDEMAFDAVKAGEASKGAALWLKSLAIEQGTKAVSSSANLSVLQIARASSGSFNPVLWAQGMRAAGDVFSSPGFANHLRSVVGEAARLNIPALGQRFVDETHAAYESLIGTPEGISPTAFLSAFDAFPAAMAQRAIDRLFGPRIHAIESALAIASHARHQDPARACETGSDLLDAVEDSLLALRVGLGSGTVQFGLIADKVANESLQCTIDFFNDDESGDSSVPRRAKAVAERCSHIASGSRVQDRIAQTITVYDKYERDRAERASVQSQIDVVLEVLHQFPPPPIPQSVLPGLSARAFNAYKRIRPHLNAVRDKVGPDSAIYVGLTSFVTHVMMAVAIAVVNGGGNAASVIALINELADLPKDDDTAAHYYRNAEAVRVMAVASAAHSKSSGCFVATAIYGSPCAPEVEKLRGYRDAVLQPSVTGRLFVALYYRVSPLLARQVKQRPLLRRLVRPGIDALVRRLT